MTEQKNVKVDVKAGMARPVAVKHCAVKVDDEMVEFAAKVATTVLWRKYGEDRLGIDREAVTTVNAVSLRAALLKAIDPTAKIDKRIQLPAYFDALVRGLRTNIGRYTIMVDLSETECTVPEVYRETMYLMKACGVTFVKIHAPNEERSETLKLAIEECDGVNVITGNLDQLDVTDLVRRSLITMDDEQAAMLKKLTGELEFQYGEVEDIVEAWTRAQVCVAVGLST